MFRFFFLLKNSKLWRINGFFRVNKVSKLLLFILVKHILFILDRYKKGGGGGGQLPPVPPPPLATPLVNVSFTTLITKIKSSSIWLIVNRMNYHAILEIIALALPFWRINCTRLHLVQLLILQKSAARAIISRIALEFMRLLLLKKIINTYVHVRGRARLWRCNNCNLVAVGMLMNSREIIKTTLSQCDTRLLQVWFESAKGGYSNEVWIFMIACSMRKLLMQVCVSFQCEQTIVSHTLSTPNNGVWLVKIIANIIITKFHLDYWKSIFVNNITIITKY